MTELRSGALKFILISCVGALIIELLLIRPNQSTHTSGFVPLALLITLIAITWRFPIPFGPQRKLYFDTTVVVAAVIYLSPAAAVFACAVGAFIGQVGRERSHAEIAFDTSQVAWQAIAASLVLQIMGWSYQANGVEPLPLIAALVVAGTVAYIVNTLLVNAIVVIQSAEPARSIWAKENLHPDRFEFFAHLTQVLIGGMFAELLITGQIDSKIALLAIVVVVAIVGFRSRRISAAKNDEAIGLKRVQSIPQLLLYRGLLPGPSEQPNKHRRRPLSYRG